MTAESATADSPASYPQPESPPAEVDGPIVQPIEVSAEFRQLFAEKGPPGFANPTAIAHRAVEREDRDDNWSYPLEAEIQNSLIAETSAGNFTSHHVECRATLCEIGLSATKAQKAAMDLWTDGIARQPWSRGMAVTNSSSIGDSNGATVVLIILQKMPVRRAN